MKQQPTTTTTTKHKMNEIIFCLRVELCLLHITTVINNELFVVENTYVCVFFPLDYANFSFVVVYLVFVVITITAAAAVVVLAVSISRRSLCCVCGCFDLGGGGAAPVLENMPLP